MDDEAALTLLGAVTREMAAAVASMDAGASVPACSGWDVTTLVDHLGRVHLWAAHCARTGEQPHSYPGRDHAVPLDQWYRGCARIIVDTLASLSPEHAAWSFSAVPGHQRAGFWRRRQVHETAVHLVDALQAAGQYPTHGAVPDVPALGRAGAADGVAEVLQVMAPRVLVRRAGEPPEQVVPATRPVALACTDTGDGWTVRLVGADVVVEHGISDNAVAVVRGPSTQLYLALWHRADGTGLCVDGDRAAGERLLFASLVP